MCGNITTKSSCTSSALEKWWLNSLCCAAPTTAVFFRYVRFKARCSNRATCFFCAQLISDYFDSTLGEKTDKESFEKISKQIDIPTSDILFITDSPEGTCIFNCVTLFITNLRPTEAKAATDANCMAAIIQRSGRNIEGLDKTDIPVIESFEDVKFSKK